LPGATITRTVTFSDIYTIRDQLSIEVVQ
jgi:hypothetical protein